MIQRVYPNLPQSLNNDLLGLRFLENMIPESLKEQMRSVADTDMSEASLTALQEREEGSKYYHSKYNFLTEKIFNTLL